MKLYNTLTRKKETFKPIKKNEASMYCCGPTVYNYAHIGNLKTYIFEDLLRRVLEYNGYKVKQVMNVTDVGHLTSDADTGEDKMLVGAKREKKTVWQIADFYTEAFFKDLEQLNIKKPVKICKATKHIKDMIKLIQRIEENGYTYLSNGNVYFDVSKFKKYGQLAKLKLESLKAGARIEVDEAKKNPHDFVLWFTKSKFTDQEMKWPSPWETGYPGWHIECSAMSMKYLGEQFDIHCGGIDHIPVHHTNEIAQSEAATKKKWVNYWLHGQFLVMDKGKMAKSKGEFLTLQSLVDKGYTAIDYRYFCVSAHYRTQLMFSYEGLTSAKNAVEKLRERVIEMKENPSNEKNPALEKKYKSKFLKQINDDLNMPEAMAVVWGLLKEKNLGNKEKIKLLLSFDKVLGLGIKSFAREELPKNLKELVEKREKARKNKDWALADKIRNELKQRGIQLKDTKQGVKWQKTD